MLNRRHFLAVAGAALAASRLRATDRGMQLHLSCGAIGIKASQQQAIDWAHRFGFDVVDADGGYLSRIGDEERKRLLDRMEALHVGWAMAGLPVDFRGETAAFEAGMKSFPAYAEALRKARVRLVTTYILPFHAERPYVANFRLHAERLRAIARVLADNNVRFGMEYVGPRTLLLAQKYPFVHTMGEMKELIAEMGVPGVGMVLDSWHWYHAGDTAADIAGLKAADVVSVDLNDAPAGVPKAEMKDGSRELPAATGVIDARAFLGSLEKIDFHGPVRAEPFNKAVNSMAPEQAIAATMAALKKAFAEG